MIFHQIAGDLYIRRCDGQIFAEARQKCVRVDRHGLPMHSREITFSAFYFPILLNGALIRTFTIKSHAIPDPLLAVVHVTICNVAYRLRAVPMINLYTRETVFMELSGRF